MIHDQLDIAYWKQVFSLPRLREEVKGKPAGMQPDAHLITSPYDIAVLEQQRQHEQFRVGYQFHDEDLVILRLLNWL